MLVLPFGGSWIQTSIPSLNQDCLMSEFMNHWKHLTLTQDMLTIFCTQDLLGIRHPAVSRSSAPAVRFCLSFTPPHQTPGCILRTGHLGWPVVSPWQEGKFPGPCADHWWSCSSARHLLSTLRQRWNFDKMGQLSGPTEGGKNGTFKTSSKKQAVANIKH